MTDDSGLALRSVVQRFDDSAAALEQLRERLRGLELAEDTQGRAASALDDAAGAVGAFVLAAERAATTLQEVTEMAGDALASAKQFLGQTDLSALHAAVAEMREEMAEVAGRQVDQIHTLNRVVELASRLEERITIQVDDARRDAKEARDALQLLEQKVAALPERTRRKAGLDS